MLEVAGKVRGCNQDGRGGELDVRVGGCLIGLMKSIRGVLLVLFSLTVFSAGEGKQRMEPEIQTAFEAAFKKLPATLKKELGDVTLKRAGELPIPKELPLEYQLLKRAAYASFSVLDREVSVYDAGAGNKPTWEGDGPSGEAVARLLAGVSDVLGVEAPKDHKDPAFQAAWREFVSRVYSWSGDKTPDPVPAIDDREFWNRFLGDGVWRLLGQKVDMEQMLFHEFGHALQLRSGFMFSSMAHWAELSGYTETKNGKAADGFVGGMQKLEEVMVLIRLLMSEDPAAMSRGGKADFDCSPHARFLNRYARYDLREDYAESFRMMAYDPGKLAEIAPEKFLYLNALGWNARGDLKNPGPLWYAGEEFSKYFPKGKRKEVFARIMGKDKAGPALSPEPLIAILRAHAAGLSADDLPTPYPMVESPDDLSKRMFELLDPKLLRVEVDGILHTAGPERQRKRQEDMIARYVSDFDFRVGMLKFWSKSTKGLGEAYEQTVEEAKTSERRLICYEAMREQGGDEISEVQWREWDGKEARFHHKNGSAWLAARYSILSSEGRVEELFAEIDATAGKGDQGFERVLFIATAVDLALRGKDPDVIATKIRAIPGKTLGSWTRARYALRASKVVGEEQKQRFRGMVEEELKTSSDPGVKQAIRSLLKTQGK